MYRYGRMLVSTVEFKASIKNEIQQWINMIGQELISYAQILKVCRGLVINMCFLSCLVPQGDSNTAGHS